MQNPFEIIADRLSNIEALLIDLKHRPTTLDSTSTQTGSKVDFIKLMSEYYPGIPESTVRQDTADLPRTKVGKRLLFDRSDIEEHLRKKRRCSGDELIHNIEVQFNNHHQRRGGRKA